ncbi:hypothetical protein Psta_1471 [Pirellula staleyi DSM 6068]|uniref:Uncharacterized protein n=1 Tax=Pirellula staleyi (strain ATCC 27377 / DSM 6068 / ICPB 4128) TaxID=530564 RepID=D2QXG1_PIRSD|nr:hypothetical protein Psta_1471 [Pirellula staleyi DSM 6068]
MVSTGGCSSVGLAGPDAIVLGTGLAFRAPLGRWNRPYHLLVTLFLGTPGSSATGADEVG